jgi:hypothetical protein
LSGSPRRTASPHRLPSLREAPWVSPWMPQTRLGFPPCQPWPEEENGWGLSIMTWSDGPRHPVPLRAQAPLTAGPGLSARLGGFPAHAPRGLGRPVLDQPGSDADLA